MTFDQELSQLLVDLGLAKPEADVYVQLLLLAGKAPASGYRVAKSLGKDATAVYRALEELQRRGAVETVAGRGKQYRPVAPAELTARLSRDFERRSRDVAERLASLTPEPTVEDVFRLHDRDQVLDRFGELLDGCERVALLDLAPRVFAVFRERIVQAALRGVTVVVKGYEDPEAFGPLPFTYIREPQSELSLELAPGDVLHGVFDCRRQLLTYLPPSAEEERVAQAFWSANAFLAFQTHAGLANAIVNTALRGMLDEDASPADLRRREEDLMRRCLDPVDWERYWTGMGVDTDRLSLCEEREELGRNRKQLMCDLSLGCPHPALFREEMELTIREDAAAYRPSVMEEIVERKRRIMSGKGNKP
jgi:HTH-type transcriptional regulator, sugar sensing transcriptional regulator